MSRASNVGAAAGQTIPHLHVHLIPRYHGDVEDPTRGVRSVIPGKANCKSRKTSRSVGWIVGWIFWKESRQRCRERAAVDQVRDELKPSAYPSVNQRRLPNRLLIARPNVATFRVVSAPSAPIQHQK